MWREGSWATQWLRSFAGTIPGGTSEIQRNIIAERVLGLPQIVEATPPSDEGAGHGGPMLTDADIDQMRTPAVGAGEGRVRRGASRRTAPRCIDRAVDAVGGR